MRDYSMSAIAVLAQAIDATQALNRSAGVWKPKVLRGRSLSCRATRLCLREIVFARPRPKPDMRTSAMAAFQPSPDLHWCGRERTRSTAGSNVPEQWSRRDKPE